jgi:hypothetical protein
MRTNIDTTIEELEEYILGYGSRDIVEFQCAYCGKPVRNKTKHDVQVKIRHIKKFSKKTNNTSIVCNRSCATYYKSLINGTLPVEVNCTCCGKPFKKSLNQFQKYNNHFCGSSCAATYGNRNKEYGTRRSKLEVWIEEQLNILYPNLTIHYCRRDTIGMELDIYIPSIKIAFELNGPTHYKPIYGEATFKAVKGRDKKRKSLCRQNSIKLIEVNVSNFTFMESKIKELNYYLDIVRNEIIKN